MKKWKRYTLGLGVAIVLGLAIFLGVFNLNAYKPRLQAWVADHYHRTLTIDGDIKLALFPHFGVRLQRIAVSEPNRDTVFASAENTYVNLALWPLFLQHVVIKHVAMQEVKLRSVPTYVFELDMQVPVCDELSGVVNPAPFNGDLRWKGEDEGETHFTFTHLRGDQNQLHADLQLKTVVRQAVRTFTLTATSPLTLNRAPSQALTLSALRGETVLTDVDLPGETLQTSYTGSLTVNMTQDSAQGHVAGATLAGNKWGMVTHISRLTHTPVISFEVMVDRLNLDKLMPVRPIPVRKKPEEAPAWHAVKQSDEARIDTPPSKKMLPSYAAQNTEGVLVLGGANAKGNIKIGHLQGRGIHAQNVSSTVQLSNGKLELPTVSATLYGGKLAGAWSFDIPHNHSWHTQMVLEKVSLGALLAGITKSPLLTGIGTLNAQLASQGENLAIIKNHLTGTLQGRLQDGTIQGVDIGQMILSFNPLNPKGQSQQEEAGRAFDTTSKTVFNQIEAQAVIKAGIVQVEHLNAVSPSLKISQRIPAQIDLHQETLDFRLNVKMLGALPLLNAGPTSGWGITVPLFVTGRYDAPTAGIDWRAIVGDVLSSESHHSE